RRRDDVGAATNVLRDVGVTSIAVGDFARARAALTESASLAPRGTTAARAADLRLAILDRLAGEHARARERLAALSRGSRHVPGWAVLLDLERASQARAAGRLEEARAGVVAVLRRGRQRGDVSHLPQTVVML